MTVLVTGLGFVGSYIARDIIDAGEDVVVYGYFGGTGADADDLPDLQLLRSLVGEERFAAIRVEIGDISDLAHLTRVCERYGVTRVAHLASLISVSSEANIPRTVRVNIEGTVNVFEVARQLGMEKVVWASSINVFGPGSVGESGTIRDDSPIQPLSSYGIGKAACEMFATKYFERFGTNITGLRLSRVYGFGEYVKFARGGGAGWLAELDYKPAVGEPSVVPFGDMHVDFQYVEDVAAAFWTALGASEGAGRTFLTSGDYRPVREAFDYVQSLLPEADMTLRPEPAELAPGALLSWSRAYDASLVEEVLGIRPRFTMEEGLHRTLSAYREQAGLPAIPAPPVLEVQRQH